MTRWLAGVMLLAVAFGGAAWSAPPTLTLPAEVKAEPGAFLKVQATTTGKTVRWLALDRGLSLIPPDELKDTKAAYVVAKAAGRYRLLAITASGDEVSEPAVVTVVVEEGAPANLASDIKAALALDKEADKAAIMVRLAALYKVAAANVAKPEAPFKTWGEVFADLAAAGKATEVDGKIMSVKKVLQAFLMTRVPTDGAKAIDADGKKLAATTFKAIADALTEASK